MRRIYGIAATMGILVLGAAAQEDPSQQAVRVKLEKLASEAKVLSVQGAVMGPTVKGAPYTADEVNENTQTLADGTRIHNENKTTVYRDSEGRIRRESPYEISIFDPVSGVRYSLNAKTQTGNKMTLGTLASPFFFAGGGPGAPGQAGASGVFEYRVMADAGTAQPIPQSLTVVREATPQNVASMKDGGRILGAGGATSSGPVFATMTSGALGPMTTTISEKASQQESLGQQIIEGVSAEGTRNTFTIDVGAIGNDRPIQIVTERWYSPDLQTVVMTKRTDPRNGEQTFQLTNIRRGEPDPSLFQVPANYQLMDRK